MIRVQLFSLSTLLVSLFAAANASAQVISVDVGFPSAAFVATAQPEYYEGRPVYYYNDHWYYRDHGRWSYYGAEPGYLHERRGHWGGGYGGYDRGRGGYRGGYVHNGGHGGGRGYSSARYHYRR